MPRKARGSAACQAAGSHEAEDGPQNPEHLRISLGTLLLQNCKRIALSPVLFRGNNKQMRLRKFWIIGVPALAFGALLSCSAMPFPAVTNVPPACFPPKYSVQPETVLPGGKVTVTAPGASCNPAYGQDAKIEVTLLDAAGKEVFRKTSPMGDDGAFSFAFTVPKSMPPGKAGVTAVPYRIDWCDDTGRNNRLKSEGSGIARASCVIPLVPLMIGPTK
jgi:hypothetical protein